MFLASTKRYMGLICGLLLPLNVHAATSFAIAGNTAVTQDLVEVGRGEMTWLWFNLYKARLLTSTGQYQRGEYPQLLDIEYYREIDAEDLMEATKDQWRHLGFAKSDIQRWLNLLKDIWPDVSAGDHLSFEIIDSQTSQFYFNQRPLGIIRDPQFAEAFLAIWLSHKTSRPSLRAQLLGEKSCEC